MPIVEIEDALLARLQDVPYKDRTKDVLAFDAHLTEYNKLLNGPHRREMLAVIKKAHPTLSIPEIDAAAPVIEEVEKIRKEFNDYRESVEKEKKESEEKTREENAHRTISDGRTWLREQGCDDEGIKVIEKLMQDEGLANYKRAFTLFTAEHPKTEMLPSTSFGGTALDWFNPAADDPDHNLLVKDPTAFKNAEVRKFFQQKAEGRLNLAS